VFNFNIRADFYNLDAIIAVGYRVKSRQATRFRICATQTLKEFILKGFVLDDERLKQGKRFGKDYFDWAGKKKPFRMFYSPCLSSPKETSGINRTRL
jgi:hypothetical protein